MIACLCTLAQAHAHPQGLIWSIKYEGMELHVQSQHLRSLSGGDTGGQGHPRLCEELVARLAILRPHFK